MRMVISLVRIFKRRIRRVIQWESKRIERNLSTIFPYVFDWMISVLNLKFNHFSTNSNVKKKRNSTHKKLTIVHSYWNTYVIQNNIYLSYVLLLILVEIFVANCRHIRPSRCLRRSWRKWWSIVFFFFFLLILI